jgi:dynein heavy chain 1
VIELTEGDCHLLFQVERSVNLLKRLTGERSRWEQGSETFKNQMSTIVGDVLLMSAFMAYAGNIP